MNLKETIDPGWLLFIESWENDGDCYKTLTQTGWTNRDLALLLRLNRNLQGFQNSTEDHTVDQFMKACRESCLSLFAEKRDKFVGDFLSCFEAEAEEGKAYYLHSLLRDEVYGATENEFYRGHLFYLRRISEIKGIWIQKTGMVFPAEFSTFYPID